MESSIPRLFKRRFHDLFSNALDLDVHLKRRDARLRAGNFKVHVTQVIFIPKDIRQDRKAIIFFNQPHRHTGNGCF